MFSFSSLWIYFFFLPLSPHLLMDSKSYMDSTHLLDFKPVSCYLSWSPDLHHFVCCPLSFFSLPALWKANEESWAEGSFCVLVKKNNLCQRKVLQQLCCRTCSLNGWRNHNGATCRWRSANLYFQPRTSNMGLCWEVSRCQNYNKPTFTCACVSVCVCGGFWKNLSGCCDWDQ